MVNQGQGASYKISFIQIDEGIDGEAFCCLTEKALETLVGKIGPRMKLLKAINNIEKDRVSSDMSSCSTPSISSRGTMEENITLQNTMPLEYSPIR